MTPRELNLHVEVYAERMKRDDDENLTLTYLGAYWQRVERMPDLRKLLSDIKPKKKQTDEEMFAEMMRIHEQMKR